MLRLVIAMLALIAAPAAAQQVRLQPPYTQNALGQPLNVVPVYSIPYEDGVVLAGRGYTVSTAVVSVAAGNFLTVELSNPAGSGVNFIMTARVFSNNVIGGSAPLEYQRFAQDAVFPASAATTVPIANRIAGGPASPGTFRYTMGSAGPTGTLSSSGFIPTNGQEKRIKDIVVLAPGTRLVYQVSGAGGGLAAMARIAVTFLYFTTPVAS
jgi:hypothetical protein